MEKINNSKGAIILPTYILTRETDGYNWEQDQRFKSRVRADMFLDTRRRAEEFARLLCIENEGDEPVEVAHVRNGILYEGMSSQVDWADLVQVVDIWERAKREILAKWDDEKISKSEFVGFVDDVIRSMGLPVQWSERLQRAVMGMRPELESSLISSTPSPAWPH
jgi:hypothetical protein